MVPPMRFPIALLALALAAVLAAGCGSSSSSTTTASTTMHAGGASAHASTTRMGAAGSTTPARDPKPGRYAGLYCPDTYQCTTVLDNGGQAAANAYCGGGATTTPTTYTDAKGAKLGFVCFTVSADQANATAVSFDTHKGKDTTIKDTVSYRYFTSVDANNDWALQPKWTSSTTFNGMAKKLTSSYDTLIRGEWYGS